MIFHFAHQSSNPTTPAMESVSAVGFPRYVETGKVPTGAIGHGLIS